MRLGLATRAAIAGAPVGDADLLAQWVSLTPSYSPQTVRPSPARPVVYLESHLGPEGYRDILAGKHDERLRAIRDDLTAMTRPGADPPIPRWDHEMTGKALPWRPWGGMDPALYVEGFRHVARILGPMFWCPGSGPKHWPKYRAYWPGTRAVSHVGFDAYDTGARTPLLQAWERPIAAIREITGERILVGDFGSARLPGVGGRLRWLRSLADVEDVWGCVYFDLAAPDGHDWRMSKRMRQAYARMREAA